MRSAAWSRVLATTALLGVVTTAAGALAAPASAQSAEAARRKVTGYYQMPFPCGQQWTGSTRPGHSPSTYAIDWNRPDDDGDDVVASAPGTVTTANKTGRTGYGRWVRVTHAGGETTVYAHLSSVAVSVGQVVDQGQLLGQLGTTGNSTGPHLHYEQALGTKTLPAAFEGVAFKYGSTTVSKNCVDVPLAANMIGAAEAELVVFRRGGDEHLPGPAAGSGAPRDHLRPLHRRAAAGRLGRRRARQRRRTPARREHVLPLDAWRDRHRRLRHSHRPAHRRRLGRRRPHRHRGPPLVGGRLLPAQPRRVEPVHRARRQGRPPGHRGLERRRRHRRRRLRLGVRDVPRSATSARAGWPGWLPSSSGWPATCPWSATGTATAAPTWASGAPRRPPSSTGTAASTAAASATVTQVRFGRPRPTR